MTPDEIKRLIAEATPGPWMVGPVDDTVVSGADGSEIAAIDGDYNEPDLWPIMEANARLIAAAPDLAHTALHWMAEAERLRELLNKTSARNRTLARAKRRATEARND